MITKEGGIFSSLFEMRDESPEAQELAARAAADVIMEVLSPGYTLRRARARSESVASAETAQIRHPKAGSGL